MARSPSIESTPDAENECPSCGCCHCSGCDSDHDCFAAECECTTTCAFCQCLPGNGMKSCPDAECQAERLDYEARDV